MGPVGPIFMVVAFRFGRGTSGPGRTAPLRGWLLCGLRYFVILLLFLPARLYQAP